MCMPPSFIRTTKCSFPSSLYARNPNIGRNLYDTSLVFLEVKYTRLWLLNRRACRASQCARNSEIVGFGPDLLASNVLALVSLRLPRAAARTYRESGQQVLELREAAEKRPGRGSETKSASRMEGKMAKTILSMNWSREPGKRTTREYGRSSGHEGSLLARPRDRVAPSSCHRVVFCRHGVYGVLTWNVHE